MCKDSSNDVKVSSIILGEIAWIFKEEFVKEKKAKRAVLMQNMKNGCVKK